MQHHRHFAGSWGTPEERPTLHSSQKGTVPLASPRFLSLSVTSVQEQRVAMVPPGMITAERWALTGPHDDDKSRQTGSAIDLAHYTTGASVLPNNKHSTMYGHTPSSRYTTV